MRIDNLTVLETADSETILKMFESCGIYGGHFTNGVYGGPAQKILPTTLAGFEFINDIRPGPAHAFLIGVNSDESVNKLIEQKREIAFTPEEKMKVEQEQDTMQSYADRVAKLAEPLALQHPDRNVVFFAYDEPTPLPIYDTMHKNGIELRSIHKWGGYGTGGAIIEGAKLFAEAAAFPFVSKDQPFALNLTRAGTQKDVVPVIDLYRDYNARRAYLSEDGKLLFGVHPSLAAYGAGYDWRWPSVQLSP